MGVVRREIQIGCNHWLCISLKLHTVAMHNGALKSVRHQMSCLNSGPKAIPAMNIRG